MTRSGATPPGGGALSPVIATFPRFCTALCTITFRPLCQDKLFILSCFMRDDASPHVMHASSCVCVCIRHAYTPTHSWCVSYPMGYPPIRIGTYMYVWPCTHTAWGTYPLCVPTRTYHCVCTYVYVQVPVLPTHALGPTRMGVYEGVPIRDPLCWVAFAALPCSVSPPPPLCPLLLRGGAGAGAQRCWAPRRPSWGPQRRSKRF